MIYIENNAITTAKSVSYLGNGRVKWTGTDWVIIHLHLRWMSVRLA